MQPAYTRSSFDGLYIARGLFSTSSSHAYQSHGPFPCRTSSHRTQRGGAPTATYEILISSCCARNVMLLSRRTGPNTAGHLGPPGRHALQSSQLGRQRDSLPEMICSNRLIVVIADLAKPRITGHADFGEIDTLEAQAWSRARTLQQFNDSLSHHYWRQLVLC